MMHLETDVTFQCAYCGAVNEIDVDESAAMTQRFTEDCQVCCRPNLVTVTIDPATMRVSASAEEDI
jgi:hypothetical protein